MKTSTLHFKNLNSLNTQTKKLSFLENMQNEPYRIFFVLGWLGIFWGAFVWILFFFNRTYYPAINHKIGMIHIFLFSYIIGFLMTAIPKFTASYKVKISELFSAFLGIMLLFTEMLSKNINPLVLWGSTLLILSTLIYFVLRRIQFAKQNPPPSFIFIAMGILISWLMSLIELLRIIFDFSIFSDWNLILTQWIYSYFVFSLILGVGSKLIPALCGWTQMQSNNNYKSDRKRFTVYCGIFILSFINKNILFNNSSNSIILLTAELPRLMLITYIILKEWSIIHFPANKTKVAWGLWVSSIALLIGEWAGVFFPLWKIHFEHITLIGGFSLMTLTVATRVGLSHGGFSLEKEKSSKRILATLILLLIAAFTRLFAGFNVQIYESHLLYASFTLICALFTWGTLMLPKFINTNNRK